MRYKTLYVSDMDGTLLDNDSLVSPATAESLSELSRQGALITVATARTPATVDPLLRGVYTRCPAIVMTGAAMWDRSDRRLINPELIPASEVATLLDEFAEHGVNPFVYTITNLSHLDVYHSVDMNPSEQSFYLERRHLELKKFHFGVPVPQDAMNRVVLMFSSGSADVILPLAEAVSRRGAVAVSCYPDNNNPDVAIIEVLARGVSKSDAVKKLANMVGAERIVAFGDNLNDIPMMEVADVAVAVENAFPGVKEQADVVIGRNSADSVAHFIEKDFYAQ